MEKKLRKKLNIDTVGKLVGPVGLPLAVLYTYCMFVHPWLARQGSWEYVQNVWDRWQTFNAAALAFAASVIVLQVARYKDEKQRGRDFRATKAFLPAALSELSAYFKGSAQTLHEAWSLQGQSQHIKAPAAPILYKDAFNECIRHATPQIGDYFANVLADLQVHEARIGELHQGNYSKDTLLYYLRSLGHLQVRLNKQFDFARGEKEFDNTSLEWGDFKNAYSTFGIGSASIGNFHDDLGNSLESVTKKLIKKLNHQAQ
ncbi:hypothetical protein [Variovorax boronicumulans]|uniref:hypothetical protein n=1 Tax=Variovorax boronicumulans TaxID=436515 RepID=UPI0033994F57